VYKENARFDVDDGKIQFIDETDFKVTVKDNVKMRKVEEEKPAKVDKPKSKAKTTKATKKTTKKPAPKPTTTPIKEHTMSPEEIATDMIDRQSQMESVIEPDLGVVHDSVPAQPKPVKIVNTPAVPIKETAEGNLQKILHDIEARNQNKELNDTIQRAIRNEPKD
jgi:hypothetical protein